MKKAEEILDDYRFKCYKGSCEKVFFSKMEVAHLIKQAQLDAIDYIVKRCAEEASTVMFDYDDEEELTEGADLMLKDHDYGLIVNKQSILNVADKLKKELND